MVGKKFKDLHLKSAKCLGVTDVILQRYQGVPSGYLVEGWGWNETAGKPLDRVLLVMNGVVVGAGEGGRLRPDVPKVIPKVTSPMVGWQAVTGDFWGNLQAFGLADGTACSVGKIHR